MLTFDEAYHSFGTGWDAGASKEEIIVSIGYPGLPQSGSLETSASTETACPRFVADRRQPRQPGWRHPEVTSQIFVDRPAERAGSPGFVTHALPREEVATQPPSAGRTQGSTGPTRCVADSGLTFGSTAGMRGLLRLSCRNHSVVECAREDRDGEDDSSGLDRTAVGGVGHVNGFGGSWSA